MLIVGCGYVGRRLATELMREGMPVHGVVATEASRTALSEQGVAASRVDLDGGDWRMPDTAGEVLFNLVPPPSRGVEDGRLQRLLDLLESSGLPRRIVHISTTGVYGDCNGDWVDETRHPHPKADRARRRWHGEQLLRKWCRDRGVELVILRVAGIYGPDKLPLARLRSSLPMVAESEAPWTNRIHVDDLVQVLVAAARRGRSGEVYNVSDGNPGNMADYFNRVADLAGLPRPPVISLAESDGHLSAGLRSYLAESRRLDNRKMLRELGVTLRYPTLEQGLASCF